MSLIVVLLLTFLVLLVGYLALWAYQDQQMLTFYEK